MNIFREWAVELQFFLNENIVLLIQLILINPAFVFRELHGHSDQQVQWADPGEGAGALGWGVQRLRDNLPGCSGGGLRSGECAH